MEIYSATTPATEEFKELLETQFSKNQKLFGCINTLMTLSYKY